MRKLYIVLILLGWGCTPESPRDTSDTSRFVAVDGVIDAQIRWLESYNPAVSKSIIADNQPENRVLQIADWNKELEIFRQLDISKPGLRGLYTLTSPAPDVRLYTRKEGEKIPVEWLKVRFNAEGAPVHIEGNLKQENYLYQSEKHLQLSLVTPTQGTLHLMSYQIEAEKRMLFSTPEHLVVKASIP